MDWVAEFYSTTGAWWSCAEASVRWIDRERSLFVQRIAPVAGNVLDLGCGYGSTALALADMGFEVTGIDLSDRIDIALERRDEAPNATFVRGDFYDVNLSICYDIVCYWDGFGIGSDDDQMRLLKRVAEDWLQPSGLAVIEVFHPSGWMADDGLEEIKEPAPALGYEYRLGHRRRFDRDSSRAVDTWWEVGSTTSISQSLRCYLPEDFESLANSAGLDIVEVQQSVEQTHSNDGLCWSYIAVLAPTHADGRA